MVTAIVLTKNEEKNIIDCLESLSFCSEIILIDDFSSDRTVEIARKLNTKVFKHHLNNDFSKQRNYGLSKAKNDWVLFIDADERVSKNLKEEIEEKVRSKYDAFFIKRQDTIWGKKLQYGEAGSIWKLRLAKKTSGKWVGVVHENWNVKGKIGKLANELDHYPHQSVAEFLREINFYTSLRAKELRDSGVNVHWYDIILYPKLKFLKGFILEMGFLDGVPGLIFALMMSFHSFLVRAKLWILNHQI